MTRNIHIVLAEKNPEFIEQLDAILSDHFECTTLCVSSPGEVKAGITESTRFLIGDAKLLLQQDRSLIETVLRQYPDLEILPAVDDDNADLIALLSNLNLTNYINRPYLEQEIFLTVKKALRLSSAKSDTVQRAGRGSKRIPWHYRPE